MVCPPGSNSCLGLVNSGNSWKSVRALKLMPARWEMTDWACSRVRPLPRVAMTSAGAVFTFTGVGD